MNTTDLIYVAGHTGLVGSALMRELEHQGYTNIITRTFAELDLTNAAATNDFFATHQPAYIFLAAAKVGGIAANSALPADFLAQNIAISFNVINAAHAHGATKLLNLGSSCIYPRTSPQPIPEDALLTGPLEPTNEAYALAKIAALKLCVAYHAQYGANFFSLMPTNMYGMGDTYDLEASHVIPALIARFHQAKVAGDASVTLWGDGTPLREFLFADDLARAAIFLMCEHTAASVNDWINVGSGQELSIAELAELVRSVVFEDVQSSPEAATVSTGAPIVMDMAAMAVAAMSRQPSMDALLLTSKTSYTGELPRIEWDASRPNGTPRKLLDSSRINALGWHATTPLHEGIRTAYMDYLSTLGGI